MGFSFNNHKILGSILVVSREVPREVLQMEKIPDSWIQVNISLMPKEGQDLTSVKKNCCPRSLLNSDSALFTMILAEGMKMVV